MIHLDLGKEPDDLKSLRETRLPLAVQAFELHGAGSKELNDQLVGYQAVKQSLWKRQHEKCAYCEAKVRWENQPVEHFRPKAESRQPIDTVAFVSEKDDKERAKLSSTTEFTHYWWLCWTWENLFFSCSRCNKTSRKGNWFPLEQGASRRASPTNPILLPMDDAFFNMASEQRLLIDPRTDCPADHLRWLPQDSTLPKDKWTWTVEGRDQRGEMTVLILALEECIDWINDHLRDVVQVAWREIQALLDAGDVDLARDRWEDLVVRAIESPNKAYRGAAWWALEWLCPKSVRAEHGFRNPEYPSVVTP